MYKGTTKAAFSKNELDQYVTRLYEAGLIGQTVRDDLTVGISEDIPFGFVTKSHIKRFLPRFVDMVKVLKSNEDKVLRGDVKPKGEDRRNPLTTYFEFMGEVGTQLLPSRMLTPTQQANRYFIQKGKYVQVS